MSRHLIQRAGSVSVLKHELKALRRTMEFSLNVSIEYTQFSDKNIFH